ncbi:4-alpha-glucanotransferase [Pseudoalteromonas sp. MMG005]|uniref:4-alpha-glucanotransferase n=1 Tax=Pseudoalteromonas sp. MMG005 TaxID=2822682 RepID=UPI001B3A2851|nr:4-alpha-glucanotransferase [Pseudoalteromonas sp. MMG005]MBQ4846801.1 4-alpha-glucanotransferase [Pseudoalteromonas sp. MMG005]
MSGLQQLFYLHGVGYDYVKYTGEHVIFDQNTRSQALQACGIDTNDEQIIAELNYQLDVVQWQSVVPEVSLVDAQCSTLSIKVPAHNRVTHGVISVRTINYEHNFDTAHLKVTGEYYYDNITYLELEVPLPPMPIGYHDAVISLPWGQYNTQIWSTPNQCFNPIEKKQLGISVQLYTLKSERNLGIGDFLDLEALIIACAKSGCDFVLLNPLHLLFPDEPDRASPYSPNHRGLINPLYISLDNCRWAHDSDEYNAQLEAASKLLETQKQEQYINYSLISDVKHSVLQGLYKGFKSHAPEDLKTQFICYQSEQSSLLTGLKGAGFAVFCQWLASRQLQRCQEVAKRSGMSVGLINDLAVGCAEDGIEYTENSQLYAGNANVGAPPDPWAEGGQNWGLPALDPVKIKHNQFSFFKTLVRSNLNYVGGLRIDHVMALRRLWWCLQVEQEQSGCYVYYPFEHLMAILKIESNIAQSMIIGEDLGVVPPEVVTSMKEASLFGNILFYFEKDHHGNFVPRDCLREDTILMVANHDVPPFKGWWYGDDLQLKYTYNLITERELCTEQQKRSVERQRLLTWLSEHGKNGLTQSSESGAIYQALLIVLASSPSKLLCLQLDDLDFQSLPVNIPGTDKEYPNWRRRLTHSIDDIFAEHAHFIKNLTDIRTGHE